MQRWNGIRHDPGRRPAARILSVLALTLGAATALEAGTVFMKNGYIIQGPVVEKTEETVVLGWENGKVMIHRRFYESVVLEPEEEAAIERRLAELRAKDSQAEPAEEVIVGGSDELPESFGEIAGKLGLLPPLASDPVPVAMDPFPGGESGSSGPLVESVDVATTPGPSDAGDGGATDVTRIDSVSDVLGRRQVVDAVGISIEPPARWTTRTGAEHVRWSTEAQRDGFRPSLSVVYSRVENWDMDEARETLRETLSEGLSGFEIVSEKEVLLLDRRAVEIQGRGTVRRGDDPESESAEEVVLSVRQMLVPGDHGFWLITSMRSAETDENVQIAMEQAIQSIEFVEE